MSVPVTGLFDLGAGANVYNSNKNAVINGDMRIAQRGTSFAPATSGVYFLDRWVYGNVVSTAVHTITQDSDTPNDQFGYSMKIDCTTADASVGAGDVVAVQQKIEGYNFQKFVGRTATLSFWVKAGKTGTMCLSLMNDGLDRAYIAEVTIDTANTWEKKTITLTFDYSGGTWNYTNGTGLRCYFTLMSGSTYQTTANAWQSNQYYATANQTNFCDATDSTCDVYITGVQLELGSVATDFEFLTFSDELVQCQRYYEKSYSYGSVPGSAYNVNNYFFMTVGWASTGTNYWYATVPFAVDKRSSPTITTYDADSPVNSGKCSLLDSPPAWDVHNRDTYTAQAGTHSLILSAYSSTSGQIGFGCAWTASAEL